MSSTRTPPIDDFRALLERELARRCAANERYSLRAFARDLRIHHSTLSQLLRKRRRVTPAAVKRLGARLRLDAPSIERCALAAAQATLRDAPALRAARALAADAFAALEEWPHLAILELSRLPEFQADSRFVARVLGIGVDEVNVALQRLLRLGLLEMSSATAWRDTSASAGADAFARATVRRLLQRLRALAAEPAPARPRRSMVPKLAKKG